jgi:hypothetical protein
VERKLMEISNVGKASVLEISFKYMNKFTLVRNPVLLSTMGKTLFLVPFENMEEFILERIPKYRI